MANESEIRVIMPGYLTSKREHPTLFTVVERPMTGTHQILCINQNVSRVSLLSFVRDDWSFTASDKSYLLSLSFIAGEKPLASWGKFCCLLGKLCFYIC